MIADDEKTGRYLGLRGGEQIAIAADDAGLLVMPDVARRQLDADAAATGQGTSGDAGTGTGPDVAGGTPTSAGGGQAGLGIPGTTGGADVPASHRRYHGTVSLDPARVGRDASQIAEELIAHLVGLDAAEVTVTLDIEARLPKGASEQAVRTVTENGRTLKFDPGSGFETE